MYYVVENRLSKLRLMYPPIKSSSEKSKTRSKYSAYFHENPFVEYTLRVAIFEDDRGTLFHYFGQPSSLNYKSFSRKPRSKRECDEVLARLQSYYQRVAEERGLQSRLVSNSKESLPEENIQHVPVLFVPNKRVKFNPEESIVISSDDLNDWLKVCSK